jgi:hypothetical protein
MKYQGKIVGLERAYFYYFATEINYLNESNRAKTLSDKYSLVLNNLFKRGTILSFSAARSVWKFDDFE